MANAFQAERRLPKSNLRTSRDPGYLEERKE
jgi:hypothetical protein